MISRLFVFGILYAAMFLGWIGVGLFMLLAPARFIKVVRDNVAVLPEARERVGTGFIVRIIGAGFVAFAIRFALRAAESFR